MDVLTRVVPQTAVLVAFLQHHHAQARRRAREDGQLGAGVLEYVLMAAIGVAAAVIVGAAIFAAVNRDAGELGTDPS